VFFRCSVEDEENSPLAGVGGTAFYAESFAALLSEALEVDLPDCVGCELDWSAASS
jgi:hypothetical protein